MTTPGQRVAAYIDGFNLYRGMHDARKRRGLWLDPESLLESLLQPGQQIVGIHYFTAMVVGPGRARQQVYLDALEAYCALTTTHIGRFQHKHHRCHACQQKWTSYEEKESDVSLGVQLVEDTALGMMDEAWIVSGDSDMAPAVRSARRIAAQQGRALRLVAVFPPRRSSHTLSQLADHTLRIFDRVPERHQLPDPVIGGAGVSLVRPSHWR